MHAESTPFTPQQLEAEIVRENINNDKALEVLSHS